MATLSPSDDLDGPVFVLGSLRSGANLVALAIGIHPAFAPPIRADWLESLSTGLRRAFTDGTEPIDTAHLAVHDVDLERFYATFGAGADRLIRESISGGENLRWVESLTERTTGVFGLANLFPAAKFVHVVRSPAEVVHLLNDPEQRGVYRGQHVEFTEDEAYRHWHRVSRAGFEVERAFGSDCVMRIRRDDLLSSPEPTLRRLFEFLNEPWDARSLRVARGLPTPSGLRDIEAENALVTKSCPPEIRTEVLELAAVLLDRPQAPSAPDPLLLVQLEDRFSASADPRLAAHVESTEQDSTLIRRLIDRVSRRL